MWPFKKKTLLELLRETKKVKSHGVLFEIKRIDPLNYLDGSKAMISVYDKYKLIKGGKMSPSDEKLIRKHLTDVLMAGIVKPKLTRKEVEGDLVSVHEMFAIPGLVEDMYEKILTYTYGKKKIKYAV